MMDMENVERDEEIVKKVVNELLIAVTPLVIRI